MSAKAISPSVLLAQLNESVSSLNESVSSRFPFDIVPPDESVKICNSRSSISFEPLDEESAYSESGIDSMIGSWTKKRIKLPNAFLPTHNYVPFRSKYGHWRECGADSSSLAKECSLNAPAAVNTDTFASIVNPEIQAWNP